ncbi:WD40 repeat-like protein [Obba rivulosa]|uniref:WD40 repeat-like protein n=1 Tax=Obba rivulosa TaxID=1052685 RepID=A0A8E2B1A7_9APHY|nr:WD40 repeat-like protein [Obba rivulosa]
MAMRREMRKGDDDPSTTYHNSERISDPTDSQLTCSVTCITFSPSGSLVAGGLEDASVRVWERDNTAQAEILGYHIRDTVQAITFSPDGAFVLSGSLDRTAFIWAVGQPSAGPVAELVGHQEAVTAAAWSPDGLHIVTGSEDGSMRLWDAKTQEQIAEWGSLIVPILSLAFSPDGRRVASGSAGHLLRIWDRDSGQTISSSMHTAAVNAVSFSPDGSRVLCGSQDGSVWIWGNSGSLLSLKLKSHQGRVLGVGFSADSSRVASGASDGTLNIWSPSINEINAIHERSADVTCLAFSPHGLHAARGHSDGTIIIDELPEMSPGIPPDEASPPEVVHPAEVPEVSLEAAHNDGQGC